MARFLVQSLTSGRFLCPSLDGSEPVWVSSLREAGGGVVFDLEEAMHLLTEYSDFEEKPQIIDLDRLGTANDYPI